MEEYIGNLVEKYGLPTALVLFFVVRDWLRENRMAARINALESQIRDILAKALIDSTTAIVKNSDVLAQLVDLLQRIPCLPCKLSEDLKNVKK